MDTETRELFQQVITGMDAGFARVDQRFAALQTEMRDGFRSVDERLASLERDVAALWNESRAHSAAVTGLSERVTGISERVAALTERVGGLEKRVDSMSDEMRQRFRTVIERLAALETAQASR